ncbi:Mu transposase C-terminal domain-containing protein [Streptomyces sp. NPDC006641]|uniref:Mu transposase C-terminal domain-containing protein n=1 Tax=unclassified Streptomyces TaxID=2593676 RepID=UPI0036B48A9E
MRWQAITERGIRIHHHTYDHDLLSPYRGQDSEVAARGGKQEVQINPHDVRQIWVRLPDGELAEIPWIHREHSPIRSTTAPGSTSRPSPLIVRTTTSTRRTSPSRRPAHAPRRLQPMSSQRAVICSFAITASRGHGWSPGKRSTTAIAS